VPISEKFQNLFRVVADGSKSHTLLLESRYCILQLDQLPLAEGSPIGGTEEEKNRTVGTFQAI
jgi:hypothetical protein